MYRGRAKSLKVLLVHPGGPFWRNKDEGAWTIPKGEVTDGEDLLAAARREFEEELGVPANGDFLPLTAVKQKGGKIVQAWAFEGDLNTAAIRSNTFTIEWPPRSGKHAEFPEIDRAAFFDIATATMKINAAQVPLLDELQSLLERR
jgi:predicted NUDIX family NTP pyrophosphohydrolase